jgi:hypothetical protein
MRHNYPSCRKGRIPAEPIVRALKVLLSERASVNEGWCGLQSQGPLQVLAEEIDVKYDTLQKIAHGRSKTLDEVLADKIACGIGRPDIYDVDCELARAS